jgi:hypothetical protein
MRDGLVRLKSFPRDRLIEDPLCRARTSELSLYQSLGEPTAMTDPSDSDPRLYWDLQWSCGMVMGLEFEQLSEELAIRLDQPDVPHALRHLGVEAYEMHLLRIDEPARFAEITEPVALDCDLWREGADGSEQLYKRGLTRRDAKCWAGQAVAHTGRRHWVVRAASAPPP